MPELDMITAKNNLNNYRSRLASMERTLDEGKRTNKERESLQARLSKAKTIRNQTEIFVVALDKLRRRFIKEDLEYRDRRLAYVSRLITDNVATIFPFEGFRIELVSEIKYGNGKTFLRITDRNGQIRLPHMSEGKMLQELIGFSSAVGIDESSGCYILYMDEAFAASDQENLGKVAELVERAKNKGMQIIMIEQSENGYKNVERREFHLVKDEITQRTSIVDIIDY